MLGAWRALGDGWADLPLLFVQLSAWNTHYHSPMLAEFRNMQVGLIGEGQTMVTAADLGDPESPYTDYHPRNKAEVGRRLALAASSLFYGNPPQPFLGPLPTSIVAVTSAAAGFVVRVTFDPFSCAGDHGGLQLKEAQKCPDEVVPNICGWPFLVDAQGLAVKATAVLGGADTFTVDFVPSSVMIHEPTSILYGQNDYPMLTVYNGLGIPLLPFSATWT